jgi:hypothetical protein
MSASCERTARHLGPKERPEMIRPATFALLVVTAILAAFPRAVAGSDDASDARCHGTHSVWFPLSDECLGVIDTDRPHQTDTPHVVAAGHVQVESALAEVQLRGPLGAPPGARSVHVVLLDDEYTLGLVSNVGPQFLFPHAAYDVGAASSCRLARSTSVQSSTSCTRMGGCPMSVWCRGSSCRSRPRDAS